MTILPHTVEQAIPAVGGRYLVLQLTGQQYLFVYDAERKRIVQKLNLRNHVFHCAAGGHTVLVYYPDTNEFESWDLATFRVRSRVGNQVGEEALSMVMGHSNSDLAFVRYTETDDRYGDSGVYVLDAKRCVPIQYPHGYFPARDGRDPADQVTLRANGSMRYVSLTPYNRGISLYAISATSGKRLWISQEDGRPRIADDGLLYERSGQVYTLQGKKALYY